MSNNVAVIQACLEAVKIPGTEVLLNQHARYTVEPSSGGLDLAIQINVALTDNSKVTLEQWIRQCCLSVDNLIIHEITWHVRIRSHGSSTDKPSLTGVKNVIAVASGKGGVGKSTTSVNLACALAQQGCRVGVLDADIYGPNQPTMLGVNDSPESEESRLEPVKAHGVYSMSMGYLVGPDQPMVWRGPMVSKVLTQLLQQTRWPDLDFLIIDMPPGTGDVQLTLSKVVRLAGAVIVSTPQDVALLDARKAMQMFSKVSIAVLGVIENMSTHICTQCGHESALFGEGGAVAMAEDADVPLLGKMPLSLQVREAADAGTPVVCAQPQSDLAQRYQAIAMALSIEVAALPLNYDHHFNVSVEADATPSTGEKT